MVGRCHSCLLLVHVECARVDCPGSGLSAAEVGRELGSTSHSLYLGLDLPKGLDRMLQREDGWNTSHVGAKHTH